jgi:hypothetical protein
MQPRSSAAPPAATSLARYLALAQTRSTNACASALSLQRCLQQRRPPGPGASTGDSLARHLALTHPRSGEAGAYGIVLRTEAQRAPDAAAAPDAPLGSRHRADFRHGGPVPWARGAATTPWDLRTALHSHWPLKVGCSVVVVSFWYSYCSMKCDSKLLVLQTFLLCAQVV